MYTLGIDVAKRRHHATLLDENGAAVFRNVEVPHSREGFERLLAKLIVSPLLAAAMAARNESGPLSRLFVTVSVLGRMRPSSSST